MDSLLSPWFPWLVTTIVVPSLGWLSVALWRARLDWDARIDLIEHRLDSGLSHAREALAAYKLDVAKNYATTGYLKDVEHRLTEHLVRIEGKLDGVQRAI